MFHKTLFISKWWVFCILFFSINGSPLQYSCLENPVEGEAWWAAVHRVAQSWTRLRRLSMHAYIGEGNGNPLQYSCRENPRDRGAWCAAIYQFSSVQFSRSVVSDSFQPHELQHARPPCPSPTPGVHSDSCPSSQWYHPATSSSVMPFSSCPNLSQHQSLFQWVNASHEVAKVLEFQL